MSSGTCHRPLSGVEVLDVGTLTPGKYCTFLLADLGASVVRVERVPRSPPPITEEDQVLNRLKRSLTLDLRSEAGREVFDRLAARADVLLESYRPGVAERMGIHYARLAGLNPRLVYCSLSGFGQDGPYAGRPAYDLHFLALSGALRALYGADRPPAVPDCFLADAVSGLTAALGIISALFARERTGAGGFLDLSMLDSIFSLLSPSHGARRADGSVGPADATGGAASPLYALYETADGRFVALGAIRPASCDALFRELGRPELASHAWSAGEEGARVAAFLREVFRSAPAAEWIDRLAKLDLEIAPVNSPGEAFDDPQLAARGMIARAAGAEGSDLDLIGSAISFNDGRTPRDAARAPGIGEHTDALLRELGYSTAEIASLRERRIV